MGKFSLVIFSDGGARGNPGKSAATFVVYKDKKVLHKGSRYLGIQTNNVAEYSGVILALSWIKENQNGVDRVDYFLDSELVVKQLNGVYRIKNESLKKLAASVKELEKHIHPTIHYHHVLREKNKLADRLVNEEIDEN